MGKTTITHDNLVAEIGDTVGITLLTGTSYSAGDIVVLQDTGKYTDALIVLSGVSASTPQMSYDEQTILVLADDYDATSGDVEGIGYTGEFNINSVTFSGAQTLADVAGILQAKNIILKDWSK